MRQNAEKSNSRPVRAPIVCAIAIACSALALPNNLHADGPKKCKHGKGHHGKRDHGHRHGSQSFLNISPGGFSYGFQNKNFGLHIGSFPPAYYEPPVVVERPIVVAPVTPPVVVPPAPPIDPAFETPPPREVLPGAHSMLILTNREAAPFQRDAEIAFLEHRYEDAAKMVNHAIVEDIENGRLYLFAAQARFAIGDYRGAVRAIEKATRLLPVHDWGFVVENFRRFYDDDNYVRQMDRLVQYNKDNPTDKYSRTVCGYHYLSLGYSNAGMAELNAALAANPGDRLATRLLAGVSREAPSPLPVPAPRPNEARTPTLASPIPGE